LEHVSPDGGILSGIMHIFEVVPEKFSMILEKGEIITPDGKDAWWDLPGLAVLLGGMWVANLYDGGFTQYIIETTLAARSLRECRKGVVRAAVLKLIIPLLVVVPGIVAYVMNVDASGVVTAASADPAFIGSN